MNFLQTLLANAVFMSAFWGWLAAQTIKTILYVVFNKEFDPERLVGSGGMPSSHSATVSALAASTALKYGVGGFEFPMAFFFAFIVMYDARGVRRETGKQASIINELVEEFQEMGHTFENLQDIGQLKELVGHTPLQVGVGCILGIIVAFIVCGIML